VETLAIPQFLRVPTPRFEPNTPKSRYQIVINIFGNLRSNIACLYIQVLRFSYGERPQRTDTKMTTYKNYTIEKVSKRGLYVVINNLNQPIAVLTLLRDCKKFIDRKVGA
jgi:hypothetical protein